MSGMSRRNSNNNKKIKNVMNVTNNVNKNNIKSIDKFNNSFSRKLAWILMASQIIFSYIEFLLQNRRKHSNILLRFINNITLSLVAETNLIKRGLVKIDFKIPKQEIIKIIDYPEVNEYMDSKNASYYNFT